MHSQTDCLAFLNSHIGTFSQFAHLLLYSTMKHLLPLFLAAIILPSCNSMKTPEQKSTLDIQGHRGARGLMPENTIPAFLEAVRLGVTTVEMDIVISADGQVVVSHDTYLSHEFCLTKEGKEISEAEEQSYNLFRMNYADIKLCD